MMGLWAESWVETCRLSMAASGASTANPLIRATSYQPSPLPTPKKLTIAVGDFGAVMLEEPRSLVDLALRGVGGERDDVLLSGSSGNDGRGSEEGGGGDGHELHCCLWGWWWVVL